MFKCNQCSYKTKMNKNISRHKESIHKGVKYDYMAESLLDLCPIGEIYFIRCFDPYDMISL